MKKRIFLLTALLLPLQVFAQDIDTSVEVTNDFSSTTSDATKISIPPAFPDSLKRFDMSFDYEVFQTPYKGAYDFTPYTIRIVPLASQKRRGTFFARAGAGYSFHPELEAVYCPDLGEKFSLSLVQNFEGYMGRYHGYDRDLSASGKISGRDLSENFAVQGGAHLGASTLSFGASYEGIYANLGDFLSGGPWHDFGAGARLLSDPMSQDFFSYDVSALYDYSIEYGNASALRQSNFALKGTLEPSTGSPTRFVTDFASQSTLYYGLFDSAAYSMDVNPKALMEFGVLKLSAGATLSYVYTTENNHFWIYPDLKADVSLLSGGLDIFAGVGGGDRINSYSSLKRQEHFFHYEEGFSGVGYRRDRYDAFAGVSGSLFSRFQYNLTAGHKAVSDAPLYAVSSSADRFSVAFRDYNLTYLDASLFFQSEALSIDALVKIEHSDIAANLNDVFSLPLARVRLHGEYNIRHRIFVGASFDSCSKRTMTRSSDGAVLSLPCWYDLSLYGEYKWNRLLSFWARGGNLLGSRVVTAPFVSRADGPYFTLGVSLELK